MSKVHRLDTSAKPKRPAFNVDGWVNVLTALGQQGRDKRLGSSLYVDAMPQEDAEAMWRGDDMAGTVIEVPPGEMVREGFTLSVESGKPGTARSEEGKVGRNAEEDPEELKAGETEVQTPNGRTVGKLTKRGDFVPFGAPPKPKPSTLPPSSVLPDPEEKEADSDGKRIAEDTTAFLDEMGFMLKLTQALEYRRAFGGAALFIGARDGSARLDKPLNMERITSIDFVSLLSPRDCRPIAWYADPLKPKFGEPEIYRIQRDPEGGGASNYVKVHETRIIRFDGIVVGRRHLRTNAGWGDSVLLRMAHVIRDFQSAWGGTAILLSDFAQAVFKIKGLAAAIQADDDELIVKRAVLVDKSRSIARAILMDSEEEFERKVTPVSGLPELLQQFALRLASSARMPVTMLMGQSPAGLNATGDSDLRWFYDFIQRDRVLKVQPQVNRFMQIIFAAKKGPTAGKEPDNWKLKWPALWQLTELEKATLRKTQAETDKIYVDSQVVMPEEVAISRFGGDEYDTETKLDRTVREAADEKHEEDKAAADDEAKTRAAELQAAAKGQPPPGKGAPGGRPPFGQKPPPPK